MLSKLKKMSLEQQARHRLEEGAPGASLHALFAGCADDLWLWVLTEGRRKIPQLAGLLPTLPEPGVQARFTGKSGDDGMQQAVGAIGVFRQGAERCGFDFAQPGLRIMDFGCGWGRITQTLLRDAEPGNIAGVDVLREALEMCAQTGLGCALTHVEPWPPTALPDASFDLIYAYSVFSHLSQENHMAWVEELASKLKPGGVLGVTTRPRSFIEMVAELRSRADLPAHARGAAAAFLDTHDSLNRYDQGEFCFDIAGTGGKDLVGFYGEAVVPQSFVERAWGPFFDRIEFIPADVHGRFDQSVIAARRAG